jgi:hypothetical protein
MVSPRVPHKKSTTRSGDKQPTGRPWRAINRAKEGELIGVAFLRGRLLNRRRPFGWRWKRLRRGVFAGFFLGHGYFVFFFRFTSS